MSVYQNKDRGGKWVYNFMRAGERYSGYCLDESGREVTSRRAAEAAEARVKDEVEKALKSSQAGRRVRVAAGYSVAEMFADYAEHKAARLRSWKPNIRRYIAELVGFFGADTQAARLTLDDVERYISASRARPRLLYQGGPTSGAELTERPDLGTRDDATTNRYLNCLRAAHNHAVKLGKLAPLHIRRLPEPEEIPTPVEPEEVAKIMASSPQHLRLAIAIAVHTGMRLDEVTGLTWEQIDMASLAIRLPSRVTKSQTGQVVHINDALAAVLEEVPGKREGHVLLWSGRPIKSLKTAWRAALSRSGVPYQRWHNLRATFATTLARSGAALLTIKDAARHASVATTMRYLKAHERDVKAAFAATETLDLPSVAEAPRRITRNGWKRKPKAGSQTPVTNEVAESGLTKPDGE